MASEGESVPFIEVSMMKSSPEKRPDRETLTTRPAKSHATPSHLMQQSTELFHVRRRLDGSWVILDLKWSRAALSMGLHVALQENGRWKDKKRKTKK